MPVGLYGKYPGKRDFISVNLPRPLMEVIERWSHAGMAASRDALGSQFSEHYMIQPIWAFRLGALVSGVDCAGLVMPSVDGVGRSFPLILVSYRPDASSTLAPLDCDVWYPDAEACLLAALDDEASSDPVQLIANLVDHPTVNHSPIDKQTVAVGEGGIKAALAELDTLLKQNAGRDRTIWWTSGGDHVPAHVTSFAGMPPATFMTFMMASLRGVGSP